MKTKILAMAASLCVFFLVAALSNGVPTAKAATDEQIEQAITDGLEWLAGQQDPGDGSWDSGMWYGDDSADVAATGLAVLKFVERAKELDPPVDPFDEDPDSPTYYEYASNVVAGFDYIFGYAKSDANGVHFAPGLWLDVYVTGITMLAVAASNAPDRAITTGALAGDLTYGKYGQALQGMMDWMVFAQNDEGCGIGGWSYGGNEQDDADQSNSGYATLGIGFAAHAGLSIPAGVLPGLNAFINNVQVTSGANKGGSIYNPCGGYPGWVNILKAGNLLYELALVGDTVDDSRVQDAISFIETYWNNMAGQCDGCGWKGDYQAMFTLMKGLEAFRIETLTVGASDIDWFDEVSTYIVDDQEDDGYWTHDVPDGRGGPAIATAWALLTLERVVPPMTQSVPFDIKPGSCPNSFNVKNNGVLPVAVLGTMDFDVTTIDPGSIKLTREPVDCFVQPIRWSCEDVATPFEGELCDCHDLNGDGYMDLTLKFVTQELVRCLALEEVAGETIPLTLTGNLKEEVSGTPITGADCVWVLNPGGKK